MGSCGSLVCLWRNLSAIFVIFSILNFFDFFASLTKRIKTQHRHRLSSIKNILM